MTNNEGGSERPALRILQGGESGAGTELAFGQAAMETLLEPERLLVEAIREALTSRYVQYGAKLTDFNLVMYERDGQTVYVVMYTAPEGLDLGNPEEDRDPSRSWAKIMDAKDGHTIEAGGSPLCDLGMTLPTYTAFVDCILRTVPGSKLPDKETNTWLTGEKPSKFGCAPCAWLGDDNTVKHYEISDGLDRIHYRFRPTVELPKSQILRGGGGNASSIYGLNLYQPFASSVDQGKPVDPAGRENVLPFPYERPAYERPINELSYDNETLTDAEQRLVEIISKALAEKYDVPSENFSLVAYERDGQTVYVVMYTAPEGLDLGSDPDKEEDPIRSWDGVMKGDHEVEIDGIRCDTRKTTLGAYEAFIARERQAGRQLPNDNVAVPILLTGGKEEGMQVPIAWLVSGVLLCSDMTDSSNWDVRLRPAVELAELI
jgi:hypothetical protein